VIFCSARRKLPPANIENPKLGFIQRFPSASSWTALAEHSGDSALAWLAK
jgi:hypothetical protein